MDQDGLNLVAGRLSDRLRQIEDALPASSGRRGSTLYELVRAIARGLADQRDSVVADFAAATDPERSVLGRKMLRLLQLSGVLGQLTPFVQDVERQDVPLGLLQIVDVLVESLLPDGADPVIHFDARYMYSTADMVRVLQPSLVALRITVDPAIRPVVFFLPAGDPANALLMPILAHEVAHAAVERSNLGSETLRRVDAARLNALFAGCVGRVPGADARQWLFDLFRWLDELLCDAMATVLCGPSMLFASAAFLPAPDPGTLGSHPFPADRIRMCLEQLDNLGWTRVLEDNCPQTVGWLRALNAPPPAGDVHEEFLRGAIDMMKDPILDVAKAHSSDGLEPTQFEALAAELENLIAAHIPPAQLNQKPTEPWAITLAAWLNQFRSRGDTAGTLAAAVADREFNNFVHKSIELARIVRVWNET